MPTTRHHPATRHLADRKPLYLLGTRSANVDAGADHLVLRQRDDSGKIYPTMRYPVYRINRVVSNHHVSWSGRALALCFARQVPLTWVDGHGNYLGSGLSRQVGSPFALLLDNYLQRPDWWVCFKQWRARRRLNTLIVCAERAAEAGQPLTQRAFDDLKRQVVYHGKPPVRFDRIGLAWCHALVVPRLIEDGLDVSYWGFGARSLNLAMELAALLWAELNLDCGTLPSHANQGLVKAQFFETWSHERERRLLDHIGDFQRHVAEEGDVWP